MANKTISNAGGNWNSTGTWAEGVIPSTNDDIFATTTSGNLTVNINTPSLRRLNLNGYNGTITLSGFLTVTSTTSGACIIPSTVSFISGAGGAMILGATNTQEGIDVKPTVPVVILNGTSNNTTLKNDLRCNILLNPNATVNGAYSIICDNYINKDRTAVATFNLSTSTKIRILSSYELYGFGGYLLNKDRISSSSVGNQFDFDVTGAVPIGPQQNMYFRDVNVIGGPIYMYGDIPHSNSPNVINFITAPPDSTDPGNSNVKLGTSYKINATNYTGTKQTISASGS